MNSILELYKAENIWRYITDRSDRPKFIGNSNEINCFNAIKEFAGLCAIGSLNKASSYTIDRPVDKDFILTFNQITKAFINCINLNKKISLSEIGNAIKLVGDYSDNIDVVCFGNIEKIGLTFGPGTSTPIEKYVEEENRKNIIRNYCVWLNCLIKELNLNIKQVLDTEQVKILSDNSQISTNKSRK